MNTTSTTVPVGSNTVATTTTATTTTAPIDNKTTTTHSYSKLDEARAQASATMAHGRASAAQLSNHPSSMRCSNCAADMTIPASVWSWHCSQGHLNDINASFCSSTGCKESKPNGVTWPAMLCSGCGTINSVPGSEGSAVVRDATASLKASLRSLTDRPATFHCTNCNTMLVTPIGQWQCQACTHTNQQNTSLCTQCKQTRESQRVLCAHCHKSTNIPASGMSDSIASGLNSLTKMARSAFLDMKGKPHVDCPVCKNAVELPKSIALNNTSNTTSSTAGVAHVAQQASLPAATAQGIPLHEHGLSLTCTNCNHSFVLGQSQARAPVGTTTSVPAQLVNMPVAPIADPNDATMSSQTSMPAKTMP